MTAASRLRPLTALLFLLAALRPTPARADTEGASGSVAEALFRDGVTLFDAGKVHEACTKFGESYRLDPANGTLQDLALCHTREGRRASAWAEFALLAGRAAQAGQRAREQMARAQVVELEKKLARVALSFGASSDVEEIAVDGETIGRAAWSTPLPLDPGEHVLTFRAPAAQKRATTRVVTVPDSAAMLRVEVPVLEAEARTAPASTERAIPASAPPSPETPAPDSHTQRTIAFVAGGAGLVLLGVGTYFGVRTFSQKSDGDAHCAGSLCDAQGLALEHDAHTSATWSTVTFGAGLALVGAGALLWLTDHSDAASSRSARVRFVPSVSARGAGGAFAVRF